MIEPVVTHAWWTAHRDEVVLADVRRDLPGKPGTEAYAEGHLPEAVFVDLDRWLAGPPSPEHGRHPLPDPEHFAEGMAQAGIGDGDTVVAYDDADGVVAARLVWMLRVTGHGAALLDGGPRHGDEVERRPATRPRAGFTPRPWPAGALADLDDAADEGNVVLDARSRARYLGADDPLDPRPGHLPGAVSLPCHGNLDDQGRLLPADVLRRRFAEAGVTGTTPVISYCGSDVTACHNLLVMEHVGLGSGRLYPGSWSQYASDPRRPAELGDIAGR